MDKELYALAAEVGQALKKLRLQLVTAESCTGGMVAEIITAVPESSYYFDRGFVTYSNNSKIDVLGVDEQTLELYGAVSEQTASEMAEGALSLSMSQISLAITGIAGPSGGLPDKPVGTVCFAWVGDQIVNQTKTKHFVGDRTEIRQQATMFSLAFLLEILKKS